MLQRITLRTLVLCLCLISVGCGITSVQVNQAIPVKSESTLSNQSIELRNCEGNEELHQALPTEVAVASTITIPDEATSVKTGATLAIPVELKTNLTDQVQSTYQQAYEDAQNSFELTDMVVPVGMIRTFAINWKRQDFSSTISFRMNNEACTASYTYTIDIPEVTLFREISCTA